MRPFDVIDEKLLGDFRVFTLHQQTLQHPTQDSTHPFFVVKTTDWVNVLAITPDNNALLIRQPRAGTGNVTVEIPGGMIDAGESPRCAAERELREETGYVAETVIPLGIVDTNPALFSNKCHTFLALNARYEAPPKLDDAEVIEVYKHPMDDIDTLLGDGTITHSLVHVAFAHYRRHQGQI